MTAEEDREAERLGASKQKIIARWTTTLTPPTRSPPSFELTREITAYNGFAIRRDQGFLTAAHDLFMGWTRCAQHRAATRRRRARTRTRRRLSADRAARRREEEKNFVEADRASAAYWPIWAVTQQRNPSGYPVEPRIKKYKEKDRLSTVLFSFSLTLSASNR